MDIHYRDQHHYDPTLDCVRRDLSLHSIDYPAASAPRAVYPPILSPLICPCWAYEMNAADRCCECCLVTTLLPRKFLFLKRAKRKKAILIKITDNVSVKIISAINNAIKVNFYCLRTL